MKSYNAYQLKLAMTGLMVLDHLKIIPDFIPDQLALVFHLATRCVAVFFAYMLVEGFLHTRNVKAYLLRLYGAAGFMALGNTLLNSLYQSKGIYISNNIFLTLAVGLTMLICLKEYKNKSRIRQVIQVVLASLCLLIGAVFTEGGTVVLPFILITYLGRKSTTKQTIAYGLLALVLLAMSYQPYERLEMIIQMMLYNADWLFILVLPILSLYNGQAGPRTAFSRYFFYIFYPLHLWLLATIGFFI
ncbi:TPA: beta-carotene 15,15'-monooxygenase [Streptococcus suis]|uniref:TraX family protein n=1 Tax=Streptococcus suis TaxID=1307 RepID=UPI002AACCDA3|nr:beta-carotene 15,15'-monooxygenase [Streptococcus suis]HEM5937095.1 beta-carotene 15,15'-monooxygenase [Streptococcus suis]HEM5941271.1 beta-carotene 15,15'-monooxygenase [Streptococcus suis]HEM5947550.1 beta-carotene 15,15'-monooxygenase [Streptococcus suis]HEM5951719.1 beta-carotene 15,15'-monooxygenase [Streptococcus suis]